jgi:glucose/arabinose dehydrogenase
MIRYRRLLSWRTGLALLAAAAVMLGLSACRPAPTTLAVSTAVGGLDRPWDLGFLPNGRIVFTERVGRVNLWDGTAKRVLGTPADIRATGEGGMLGLAVDPNFSSNRFVYTCFNSTALDVRVVRWKINSAGTALTARTDLVTGIPANSSGRHSGCRPRFGPDGYLWIGTGDAAMGINPQSPTSLGGKVLRVDRNGAPAAGNPGVTNPGSPLDDRIYTYGHRNVQGLAFRADGAAFSVEHGTGCDDEINLLVAGGNYGWDPAVNGNPSGYDESKPMTDLVKFPNAVRAAWSSGCPTIAPSGATFLSGSKWAGWDGAMAVAVLKDHRLQVFYFDGTQGNRLTDVYNVISDQGRLRSAVQGPDGNLYIATDTGLPNGKILKVVPTP